MKASLTAELLRDLNDADAKKLPALPRSPLYFILDSIYDTYNIGGLFRLADALAIEKIYICGDSETPPNHRIQKASIGTYKVVPWEYCESAADAIAKIRSEIPHIQVISVELDKKALPYNTFSYMAPTALVLGNETSGVSKQALDASDAIVQIPMRGYNVSMNVIVSAAIVASHAIDSLEGLDD